MALFIEPPLTRLNNYTWGDSKWPFIPYLPVAGSFNPIEKYIVIINYYYESQEYFIE